MATKDEIIQHHAHGTLTGLIMDTVRAEPFNQPDEAFRAELVALHNNGSIDVLALAATLGSSADGFSELYPVHSLYAGILPQLNAGVPAMLQAVRALTDEPGVAAAGGMAMVALGQWAELGGRARALIAEIDPTDITDRPYLYLALHSMARAETEAALDLAAEYLAGAVDHARITAADVIGRMPFVTAELAGRALDLLDDARLAGPDDRLPGHILGAMVEITAKIPELETRAITIIDNRATEPSDHVIEHVSSALMLHVAKLSSAMIGALAPIIQHLRPQHADAVNPLDIAAYSLVQQGRIDEALVLVTPILAAREDQEIFKRFDSFAHILLQIERERLARVIIDWLRSPRHALRQAANRLVACWRNEEPLVLNYDAATLDFTVTEARVLAHRAIGYLFFYPVTAVSLLVPLLRLSDPKLTKAVEALLFNPMLINFSGGVTDWLKTKAGNTNDPARPAILRLLAHLDVYLEGLQSIGRPKELCPSERERMIENFHQDERLRRVHRQAREESVLLKHVGAQLLLYGKRSISYVRHPDGQKRRLENKLHTFSHVVETPRLDVLDPFELDWTLRNFRHAKGRS